MLASAAAELYPRPSSAQIWHREGLLSFLRGPGLKNGVRFKYDRFLWCIYPCPGTLYRQKSCGCTGSFTERKKKADLIRMPLSIFLKVLCEVLFVRSHVSVPPPPSFFFLLNLDSSKAYTVLLHCAISMNYICIPLFTASKKNDDKAKSREGILGYARQLANPSADRC